MEKRSGNKRKIPCWVWAFLLNLTVALAAIAPMLIKNHGYMAMSHDFSAQEIPFNMLMNDTVKSGNLLWNWAIDLGGNFLESFSFYNLGSVFFWLMLLFPAEYMSRVMGWMIILKFAVAGATSAAYFTRHIKKKTLILFASLLYAFSGFQCGTVVFYHFQDQVALFPLLLIGLEQLVEEKKPGRLTLACVLNVLSNYVFFVGEVLFLAAYYVMKYFIPQVKSGEKRISVYVRPIFGCILEGVMGMLISAVILLPSVRGMLANSRVSSHILGEAWFTMTSMDWLMLLKAVLMPAESMNSMSSIVGADWMSNMAYLPMVGMLLVFAYAFTKKDWISGLLKLSLLVAAVPVLNSVFMAFNNASYRRWYYMVILIMALASARVLEDADSYRVKKAAVCLAVLYCIFWSMLNIVRWDAEDIALVFQRKWFYFGLLMGVGGAMLTFLIIRYVRKPLRGWLMCAATAVCSCILLAATVYEYASTTDNTRLDFKTYPNTYGENVYNYLTEIPGMLDRDVLPWRYYFDEWVGYTYYNLSMANSLPSINSFISTAHPSVMEFYDYLGIGRLTWTNADNTGTRELLSARYVVSTEKQPEYDYITELTNSNGQIMYLYENTEALPIGFTYDTYILESEFEALDKEVRATAMLGYLVVKDEDEEKVEGILNHLPWADITVMNVDLRSGFLEERRKESSSAFRSEDNAFESHIMADSKKYAFFSVPYDQCWEASVNGEKREILNINGLMAVRIDAGENEIRFDYVYKPFLAGLVCTGVGIAAWGLYLGMWYREKRRKTIK